VDRIKAKLDYSIAQGQIPNYWMLPDDGGLPYKDEAAIKAYFGDIKQHLGGYVEKACIVVALEANEKGVFGSGGRKWVQAYATELHKLFPDATICNHMTSGEYGWSKDLSEIDVHFHQVDPRKSIQACEDELKNVVANCPKPVMACEISLHGKSDEAREKAKRALAAGCIGVHSGVPKE